MKRLLLIALFPLLMGASSGDFVKLSGHVKAFGLGTVPYASRLMPPGAVGSAVIDARLKLKVKPWTWLTFSFDPTMTATLGGAATGRTGVGLSGPELVSMTAYFVDGPTFQLRFRMDRALMAVEMGPVRLTVGRQPITFGQGQMFTPMDLVAPFNPSVLDTSHKPGVDAVRADVFIGMSGKISVLGVYLGEQSLGETGVPTGEDPEPVDIEDVGVAVHGGGTVVTVDLHGFLGMLYGDFVGGASVYAPIGPIGLYGDVTVTVANKYAYPRAVVGVLVRPTPTTTVSAEIYAQRFGTTTRTNYLAMQSTERFLRGELWQAGHLYGGLVIAQEITPLVSASAVVVANLLDPSAFISGNVAWSVASNADLSAGVQIGVGKKPDEELENPLFSTRSEFGLIPVTGFVQLGVYF
ncbi:MAG: hypothetical protein KDA24_22660 [Deltaproteobacteria bacterium]|nr:hypothetical protein [Deltaproteobacteria bacterium]